jgi:hypothetical protein
LHRGAPPPFDSHPFQIDLEVGLRSYFGDDNSAVGLQGQTEFHRRLIRGITDVDQLGDNAACYGAEAVYGLLKGLTGVYKILKKYGAAR